MGNGDDDHSNCMSMGSAVMKYSVVSREGIAGSIEICVRGLWMDGVLAIDGCDKHMPRGVPAKFAFNAATASKGAVLDDYN